MNELERVLREAEVPDAVAARERARQTVLAGHNMAAVPPAWDPHVPRTVAWAAQDGLVTVEDADTAQVQWSFGAGSVRSLTWSPEGRRLVIAGRRWLTVHDFRTGKTSRTRQSGEITAVAYGARGLAGRRPLARRAG